MKESFVQFHCLCSSRNDRFPCSQAIPLGIFINWSRESAVTYLVHACGRMTLHFKSYYVAYVAYVANVNTNTDDITVSRKKLRGPRKLSWICFPLHCFFYRDDGIYKSFKTFCRPSEIFLWFWIVLYFVVFKVLSYKTPKVFLLATVKYLHELLHPCQQHLPLKPPYWKLCLRETNFDSFWDAPIGSLLCLYDEGCSHLFLPCITET